MEANLELRHVLVDAAKKYDKVILPGYTHMQHAQPVLLSHHLLAYSSDVRARLYAPEGRL